MGLLYEVMTEQQAMAQRFQLLTEGEYDAVITSSKDTTSLKGHPMMEMTLKVFDDNGREHDIRDFLVFTGSMMWRVIHFAKSADLLKEYEEGKLCSELVINKLVRVKIVIEKGKEIPFDKLNGKPAGTCYYDKNKVDDYVGRNLTTVGTGFKSADELLDDDIPFI